MSREPLILSDGSDELRSITPTRSESPDLARVIELLEKIDSGVRFLCGLVSGIIGGGLGYLIGRKL